MKSNRLSIIIFLLVTVAVFAAIAGCDDRDQYLRVEDVRAKLIDGIESYQSVEEFKARVLVGSKHKWKFNDNPTTFNGKRPRPPFVIQSIIVEGYIHLGFEGELEISFFNNRLLETRFRPTHFIEYVRALRKNVGSDLPIDQENIVDIITGIVIVDSGNDTGHVIWYDKRLHDQFTRWITKYS